MRVLQESKIKNMSLRSNLAVRAGEGKDIVYRWVAVWIAYGSDGQLLRHGRSPLLQTSSRQLTPCRWFLQSLITRVPFLFLHIIKPAGSCQT